MIGDLCHVGLHHAIVNQNGENKSTKEKFMILDSECRRSVAGTN